MLEPSLHVLNFVQSKNAFIKTNIIESVAKKASKPEANFLHSREFNFFFFFGGGKSTTHFCKKITPYLYNLFLGDLLFLIKLVLQPPSFIQDPCVCLLLSGSFCQSASVCLMVGLCVCVFVCRAGRFTTTSGQHSFTCDWL